MGGKCDLFVSLKETGSRITACSLCSVAHLKYGTMVVKKTALEVFQGEILVAGDNTNRLRNLILRTPHNINSANGKSFPAVQSESKNNGSLPLPFPIPLSRKVGFKRHFLSFSQQIEVANGQRNWIPSSTRVH